MTRLMDLPAWQTLHSHYQTFATTHMRDLFAADPERFQKYSVKVGQLLIDYSKNRFDTTTLSLLIQLANECQLQEKIQQLFSGALVNTTEQLPALHTALRNGDKDFIVAGQNITTAVKHNLNRLQEFCDKIHQGIWKGFAGQAITDVVNIGIGGSDLGPRLVTEALTPYHTKQCNLHFISNIDGTPITALLDKLNPATTLFIVSSKSFTTFETLLNANLAKEWLQQPQAINQHFIAVTAQPDKAVAFGLQNENIFVIDPWVGGRFSLWSAMGLPIALKIGMQNFRELLAGAHVMDQHFHHTPFDQNIPVILALLTIWYTNFFNCQTHAILPYDDYLCLLPSYLQQLFMESCGKNIDIEGNKINYATGPIIWGGVGDNGQHAFHQLLHQGTQLAPADFIIALQTHHHLHQHQAALFANCVSQSQALMQGKTKNGDPAYKSVAGNKPSNTILLKKLTPHSLGSLLALYEHKTFVQAAIWNINPFDQWGVELGKNLANTIFTDLLKEKAHTGDSSTIGLLKEFISA